MSETKKVQITDRVPISTRRYTDDGYLRASASLTRTGIFEYRADEVGLGDSTETVRILRNPDSTFHPDTVSSLRGAPVTLQHPREGQVTPHNWQSLTVGTVAGEPSRIGDSYLGADLLIGDKNAIRSIENGTNEISIGYALSLASADGQDYDYVSEGPIRINHVAIVDRGRAGPEVRIHDKGESIVDESKIVETVQVAIRDGLAGVVGKDAKETPASINPDVIAAGIMSKITPVLDEMKKVIGDSITREAEAQKAKHMSDATAAANAAAEKLVAETIKERDAYHASVADAMELIPKARHPELIGKPIREILAIAVGDAVPVDGASEDFLKGVVTMLKGQRQAQFSTGAQFADNLSGGFKPSPQGDAAVDQSREGAYNGYVKSFKDDWLNRHTGMKNLNDKVLS